MQKYRRLKDELRELNQSVDRAENIDLYNLTTLRLGELLTDIVKAVRAVENSEEFKDLKNRFNDYAYTTDLLNRARTTMLKIIDILYKKIDKEDAKLFSD